MRARTHLSRRLPRPRLPRPRAPRPRPVLPGWAYLGLLTGLTGLVLTVTATSASAESGDPAAQGGALSWITLKDTHGISVWNYGLDLKQHSIVGGIVGGGGFNGMVWGFLLDLQWTCYRTVVAISIWMLDWILSFAWLDTVLTPVRTVCQSLETTMDKFGVVPTFMTIAGAVAAVLLIRGRTALAVYEFTATALVAALGGGPLRHPYQLIESGIIGFRDFGMGVGSAIATNGQSAPDLRSTLNAQMVGAFVRLPHQLVNYGSVLDGGRCQSVYDTALAKGSGVRDAVSGCDKALGAVASQPSALNAMAANSIMPAATCMIFFALVLGGVTVYVTMQLLFNSAKAVIVVITALLPGGARGSLWSTVADVIIGLLSITFVLVFSIGYMVFLVDILTAAGAEKDPNPVTRTAHLMQTFWLVDLLVAVGTIIFWVQWRRMLKARCGLAQTLGTRPGAAATSQNRRGAGELAGLGMQAVRTWKSLSRHTSSKSGGSKPAPAIASSSPSPAATPPPPGPPPSAPSLGHGGPTGPTRGPSGAPTAPGGGPTPSPVPAQRTRDSEQSLVRLKSRLEPSNRHRLAKTALVGGKIAMVVASGGTAAPAALAGVGTAAKSEAAKRIAGHAAKTTASRAAAAAQNRIAARKDAPRTGSGRPVQRPDVAQVLTQPPKNLPPIRPQDRPRPEPAGRYPQPASPQSATPAPARQATPANRSETRPELSDRMAAILDRTRP